MPVFTPPTRNEHNLSDFDITIPWSSETRFAYRLLRHFQPGPRGINVFKLVTGEYVENEPADMTTVVTTYYGGHKYDITDEEEAALIAAGYGDYVEAS